MQNAKQFLLDTNILLAYVRAGPLGTYLESTYSLMSQPFKPLLCIVSVGEILALSLKLGWGDPNVSEMERLLGEIVWVDIRPIEVQHAYAEICRFSESHGMKKGQNDYWIAAVAKVTKATLLTTDKDFDHLHGTHLTRIWIDERIGKSRKSGSQVI